MSKPSSRYTQHQQPRSLVHVSVFRNLLNISYFLYIVSEIKEVQHRASVALSLIEFPVETAARLLKENK